MSSHYKKTLELKMCVDRNLFNESKSCQFRNYIKQPVPLFLVHNNTNSPTLRFGAVLFATQIRTILHRNVVLR